MAYEFRLPDIGEGVHEGEIVKWLVAEGDAVEEDQDIVEVMTDKATVQISSPVAGTIQNIKFQDGEVVNVGDVFVVIAPSRSDDEKSVSAGAEPDKSERKQRVSAPSPEPERAALQASELRSGASPNAGRRTPFGVLAPPSVRIEARRRGIDLTKVAGSARGGRVTLQDLKRHTERGETRREAPASAQVGAIAFEVPAVSREDATGVEPIRASPRSPRASAARAKALQAHFSYVLEVPADRLVQAVEHAQSVAAEREVELDDQAFVLKAVAVALAKHPRCNALVDERSHDLVVPRKVNLGVALPTAEGLRITVIGDAASKGVLAIAEALENGSGDDVEPTITVTELGPLGGIISTPVLVHPQVTGITIGALHDVAALRDGKPVPSKQLTLSFAFDHRYIDGYDGALFANEVARLLASPAVLLSQA